MKPSFVSRQAGIVAASALALVIASGAVNAQNFGPPAERELWTTVPQQVWKNGYGECWHSAFGPPPPAGECDPAPRMVQVAAPPPPPPAPAPYVAPPRVEPPPVVMPPERPRRPDRN
jgi:hypothetical protein